MKNIPPTPRRSRVASLVLTWASAACTAVAETAAVKEAGDRWEWIAVSVCGGFLAVPDVMRQTDGWGINRFHLCSATYLLFHYFGALMCGLTRQPAIQWHSNLRLIDPLIHSRAGKKQQNSAVSQNDLVLAIWSEWAHFIADPWKTLLQQRIRTWLFYPLKMVSQEAARNRIFNIFIQDSEILPVVMKKTILTFQILSTFRPSCIIQDKWWENMDGWMDTVTGSNNKNSFKCVFIYNVPYNVQWW